MRVCTGTNYEIKRNILKLSLIHIYYHSVAADYDRDTIKDINRKLPNLLVKNGGVALDELADEYGFESTCDLIDMFLAYTPKRVRLEQLVSQFLEENPQPSGDYDGDVPF